MYHPLLIQGKSFFQEKLASLSDAEKELFVVLLLVHESISKSNLWTKISSGPFSDHLKVKKNLYAAWEKIQKHSDWIEEGIYGGQLMLTSAGRGVARFLARETPNFSEMCEYIIQRFPFGSYRHNHGLDPRELEKRWLTENYKDLQEGLQPLIKILDEYEEGFFSPTWIGFLHDRFLNPWIPEAFAQLPLEQQQRFLRSGLQGFLNLDYPLALETLEYLEQQLHQDPKAWMEFMVPLGVTYLRQGKFQQVAALQEHLSTSEDAFWQLKGTEAFFKGDYAAALKALQKGFTLFNQGVRGRKHPLPGLPGSLMPLAMIGTNPEAGVEDAVTFLRKLALTGSPFLKTLLAKLTAAPLKLNEFDTYKDISDSWFIIPLPLWSGESEPDTDFLQSEFVEDEIMPMLEIRQLLWDLQQLRWLQENQREKVFPTHHSIPETFVSLIHLRPREEEWERALKVLSAFGQVNAASASKSQQQQRLAWRVDLKQQRLTPVAQRQNKTGAWSDGRVVALKRLKGGLPFMSEQDYQVASQIREHRSSYYYSREYDLPFDKALPLLAGHPLLFQEGTQNLPLELVTGKPELLVQETPKGFKLTFPYKLSSNSSLVLQKETPTRYRMVIFSPEQRQLREVFQQQALTIPASGKEQLSKTLNNLSAIIPVTSPLGIGEEELPEVPASTQIHAHLLPLGEGLRLELLVRPLGDGGPYSPPGKGSVLWVGDVQKQRTQTKRSLKKERDALEHVLAQAPYLSEWPHDDGEWRFEDPEDCLEILQELQELGDQVQVEWPEGQSLRLTRRVDLADLTLQIKQKRDWFQVDGAVELSPEQTLSLQALLNLLEHRRGRFVPLGDQQFLALTEQFQKRLEELQAFTESAGNQLRLHDFAAPALEEWVDSVGKLETDARWKERLQKLREAQSLTPAVPSTLQAQLRDYQQEGFTWLTRLAHWEAGACLADDMGLGKTLQAIAVLLERAPQGPALVLAPASVAQNWVREIHRFAPTLRPVLLAFEDRQQVVQAAEPFEVIISSYGLLPQETETLCARRWSTLVLDEAQAIKNAATKRSQSVMKLEADFRVATTGTPMENHLGELWNLFRFLNPGLLGSREHFQSRFAVPIERDHNAETRRRLRKLIRPFILRRLKHEVLHELPPKTEIVLSVELSAEERVFYEALRQKALEDLAQEEQAPPGARNLKILAQITRLRQACCHPKLVLPETPLPGSKLQLFQETLEELLENRHKVLVFSQFVSHLSLLEAHLQKQKIAYQYLDGSTPQKQRQRAIDAFQRGEGDVFLISLKAGGTGLNLTAADYVIHMDPWWNPAVEDQASDRAHRIGQERPVTIYRLVTQGTIEERIVSLHHEKRDLANSLLEGNDRLSRLSPEDLLQLLKEEHSA